MADHFRPLAIVLRWADFLVWVRCKFAASARRIARPQQSRYRFKSARRLFHAGLVALPGLFGRVADRIDCADGSFRSEELV